jgi:hypothetical protein
MTISVKHIFERRLGLFPVVFDDDGTMHVETSFGDYPQWLPALRPAPPAGNLAGMMLLAHGKKATASSSLDGLGPERAFDEDVKTYWSARSAAPGEWLAVDLGAGCRLQAVQINFAEHEATQQGRVAASARRYRLEVSGDGASWSPIVDRSASAQGGAQGSTNDLPHDYVELADPVSARQVRLVNAGTPGGGPFSVRDLRLFGGCAGPAPPAPRFEAHRDPSDTRNAVVRWEMTSGADGYRIRYGALPGKLYQSYEVRDRREVALHGLNAGVPAYFTVDAFNASGLTLGTQVIKI